jgi:hypothetical protein
MPNEALLTFPSTPVAVGTTELILSTVSPVLYAQLLGPGGVVPQGIIFDGTIGVIAAAPTLGANITFNLRRGTTTTSTLVDSTEFVIGTATASNTGSSATPVSVDLVDTAPPVTQQNYPGLGGAIVPALQTGVEGLPQSGQQYVITAVASAGSIFTVGFTTPSGVFYSGRMTVQALNTGQ